MISRITSTSLQAAGVRSDEMASLGRQARGGASGGHGYGYEDHFAIARLVAASVAWLERGEDWMVSLGHPCCWVDDVVVEGPDVEEYAQLKTSAAETWGKHDGLLIRRFRRQAEVCRARGVQRFTLKIVTPHEERRRHFAEKMPDELRSSTSAERFPDAMLGWGAGSPVAAELAELSADQPTSSVREQLVCAFYAAYHQLRRSGQPLTTSRLTATITVDERVPLRSDARVADEQLFDAVSTTLIVTLNIRLRLQRGFIVYEIGEDERGVVARADSPSASKFLARVAAHMPGSIDEFHRELP